MKTATAEYQPPFRERLAMGFVSLSKPVYFLLRFRRKAWNISKESLREMPENTLGSDLEKFLRQNGLSLMPKAEFHDVYHVLFGFDTSMHDETCIQFLSMGNGRWTLPHIVTTLISILLYPDYLEDFIDAFNRGRRANKFHDWNFEAMLSLPTRLVRDMIFFSSDTADTTKQINTKR